MEINGKICNRNPLLIVPNLNGNHYTSDALSNNTGFIVLSNISKLGTNLTLH